MPYDLIYLVVVLVIVGLALWILQQIPMDAAIARIIRVVVIVAVCIYLLFWLLALIPEGGSGFLPHRHY